MPLDDPFIEKLNSYWTSKLNDSSKRSGADYAAALYLLSKGISESSLRNLFEDPRVNLSQKYLERKTQNPSAARSYLDMTIRKALAATQMNLEGDDISKYRLDAFSDVEAVRVATNTILKPIGLPGIVGLTIISGPPKIYKSWFGLVSVRDAVLGGSKALILDFENGPYRTRKRLEKVFPEYQKYQDSLFYWPGDKFSVEKLDRLITKLGVDFVMIDPIQKMSRNADNYFGELRQILASLEDIKKLGEVAILGISQIKREEYATSSMGSGFGSNAIEYNSDLLLTIRRGSDSINLIVLASRDWVPNKYILKLGFGERGLEVFNGAELLNRGDDLPEMDKALLSLAKQLGGSDGN